MKIASAHLTELLNLTARPQFVNGKPHQQVIGCVLRPLGDGFVSTTSLVRDGKTSLSHFIRPAIIEEGDEAFVIPDIERLLGVISAYTGEITIRQDNSGHTAMLRVKGSRRQTSLVAESGALAFPHTSDTIAEWEQKSIALSEQINSSLGTYTMRDGSKREPFCSITISCSDLYEALKTDILNSQKLNRYTFHSRDDNKMYVVTGESLKGQTEYELCNLYGGKDGEALLWQSTYEGGLDRVVASMNGDVTLHFLDFRPEGQGIRLVAKFDCESWVYQAAILMR